MLPYPYGIKGCNLWLLLRVGTLSSLPLELILKTMIVLLNILLAICKMTWNPNWIRADWALPWQGFRSSTALGFRESVDAAKDICRGMHR